MLADSLDEFLNHIQGMDEGCKLYIWGISVYGDLLGRLFHRKGISWDGYYDNFCNSSEEILNSKPVYQGTQIDSSENAAFVLTMRDYKAVRLQLLSAGIREENIICFGIGSVLDSLEDALGESMVSVDDIRNLYDKHHGEKCFIIGNGPSLNIEDLDQIYKSRMISFASNLIFRCYAKTEWRPEYYFFVDVTGIREELDSDEMLNYVSRNCKYMFSRSNGNLVQHKDKIDNLLLYRSAFSRSENSFDFSEDCSRQIYIGYTVTYAMIQAAVYMGFQEIYLLGMDHSFSIEKSEDGIVKNEGVVNHSELLGNYAMWGLPDMVRATRAYLSSKKYADSHGIKIYNATRGGKLEVFERVNFDELFR